MLGTYSNISRMNRHDRVPHAEENIERLLTLKWELCKVEGCNRKHIYRTPKGVFCGRHREEAMEVNRAYDKRGRKLY